MLWRGHGWAANPELSGVDLTEWIGGYAVVQKKDEDEDGEHKW